MTTATVSTAGGSTFARAAMFAAFFLSGGCGLAYEVVWTRLISREVGHTSFALATVLAAFMGGLALGSWAAMRLVGRLRNPIAWYGVLEIAIGLSALGVPVLLRMFHPALGWLYRAEGLGVAYHAARFGICALVLLVPTTCMGATLSFLAEPLVRRREELGGTIGWLYATNTLGAVAGAMAAGFLLVPSFGLSTTIRVAAVANVVAGVVALLVARGVALPSPGVETPSINPRGRPIYLWGMLLSGALAMANQVVWTRYLSLQIGTSVYAFTIIVSAFILGMAAGSLYLGRRADRSRDPLATFGKLQLAIGFSCLLLYLLFHLLAVGIWDLVEASYGSFARTQAVFFGAVFSIVFLPTFFLGGTFPTAVRGYVPEGAKTGPAVGRVYAWNTVGAILGSFAGGFLVVPHFGIWRSILWLGVANAALGAYVLARSAAAWRRIGAVGALGCAALGAFAMPDWSDEYLMQGAYVYAAYTAYDARERGEKPWVSPLVRSHDVAELICYHRDGASGSISVVADTCDVRSLRIDGRVQASNAIDMPTQVLTAQLPLLLHPGTARHVLTIGLGSGVTAGSATVHPGVHVDCVEISPEVVDCAQTFYRDVNLDICDRPDARVLVEDARSHIAFTDRLYDVIASEPSHVFISGMGDLFTKEHYALCRSRLAPGGLMTQWVQAYWHTQEDVRTIVATFMQVFPHTWMWEADPGQDYLLVGATDSIDFGAVTSRWTGPVAKEMSRIGFERPAQLFAGYVAGPEELARWVAGARLQDDDTVHLEYSAPRGLYGGKAGNLSDLHAMREAARHPDGWPEGAQASWCARVRNVALRDPDVGATRTRLEEAMTLVADDPNAGRLVRRLMLEVSEKDDEGMEEVARRFPDSLDMALRAGQVAYRANRPADAEQWLRGAAERFPRAAEPYFQLARLLWRTGSKDEALRVEEQGRARWESIRKGAPQPTLDSPK